MDAAPIHALFAALESIAAYEGAGVPPGLVGSVDRIVHELRNDRAPLADTAESIALDLHRLGQALGGREGDTGSKVAAIKRDLSRTLWQRVADAPLLSVA